MISGLSVRPATADDLDAVIGLRIQAETWLRSAGIHQWVDRERGIRDLRNGIRAGETHVAVEGDGTVVATLTLSGPDDDFWRCEDAPDSALYLYKFMIDRRYRGSGLGDELLDWACATAEQRGKTWLRLDCWHTNEALQRYYLRRGFHHVRTEVVQGRGSGALFQRPAALRTARTHRLASQEARHSGSPPNGTRLMSDKTNICHTRTVA